MNKEQQVRKMLEFVNMRSPNEIVEHVPGQFNCYYWTLPIADKEYNERDRRDITINFNVRQATWAAYYQSHSRSKTYGHIAGAMDWDKCIDDMHSLLRTKIKSWITNQIVQEDNDRERRMREMRVENRINEMFVSPKTDIEPDEYSTVVIGPVLKMMIDARHLHPDYRDNPQSFMLDEIVEGFDEYTLLEFENKNRYYTLTIKGQAYIKDLIDGGHIILNINI